MTASKLCARKRPDLFPVRDKEVCDYLGLTQLRNYQADWQVFRSLIGDPDITAAIDVMSKATTAAAARTEAASGSVTSAPARCWDLDIYHVTSLSPRARDTTGRRHDRTSLRKRQELRRSV